MTQEKRRERDKLRKIIDSLQDDPATTPIDEINDALQGEGIAVLRAHLYERAHEFATAQRKSHIPVSRAVQKFLDAMNTGPKLPQDSGDAFARAVQEFRIPPTSSPSTTPRQVAALRKLDKDLSLKDKTILKSAAERLRKRRDETKK